MTLALLLAMLVAVQAPPSLPTLYLPSQEGAWVVRVETSGGFTGRGTGHFTANSAGEILCLAVPACPAQLLPETRRQLSRLVAAVPDRSVTASPRSPQDGVCNDCVTTTMTVHYRTTDGERTQRYSWDVTTAKAIPEEVLRLYTAVGQAISR